MSDRQWMKDAANEIEPYTFLDVAQIIARHYAQEAARVQELRTAVANYIKLPESDAAFEQMIEAGEGWNV